MPGEKLARLVGDEIDRGLEGFDAVVRLVEIDRMPGLEPRGESAHGRDGDRGSDAGFEKFDRRVRGVHAATMHFSRPLPSRKLLSLRKATPAAERRSPTHRARPAGGSDLHIVLHDDDRVAGLDQLATQSRRVGPA